MQVKMVPESFDLKLRLLVTQGSEASKLKDGLDNMYKWKPLMYLYTFRSRYVQDNSPVDKNNYIFYYVCDWYTIVFE